MIEHTCVLAVSDDTPVLMLKTFTGAVIKLEGINLNVTSSSGGMMVNNMMIPITELKALARFPIQEDEIEKLSDGVSKIRLTTTPIIHEREFKKDVIGIKLYNMLKTLNEEEF